MDRVNLRAVMVMLVVAAQVTATRGAALSDGEELGPANWAQAQGLLPEEILAHYRLGEYRNPVLDVSGPQFMSLALPAEFRDASRQNEGRYALSPEGSIVEARTGAPAGFILGYPFPTIDPADPAAGTKIVWNYFYNQWYSGDCHFLSELLMLNRHGVERSLRTDVKIRMYAGAPEARGRANPENLFMQTLATVTYPTDLAGIVSLTYRYRDPTKPDSLWTYVPGLRRTRQVSTLNRSDGFLGSDISLDEGAFFDGKPETFTFRVLEAGEQLVLVDPYSVRGEADLVPVHRGGWRIVWKDVPRIGADAPGWTGLPWAPISAVLVRRPIWIVEAIPKDPNYLFGRVVLRVDAETFHGAWTSKYDRAGSLLISYQASRGAYYRAGDDGSYVPAGGIAVRTAENFLYDRATVVIFPPRNPKNPADYHVPLDAAEFSSAAIMRLGK
jgi:hypothetical protein